MYEVLQSLYVFVCLSVCMLDCQHTPQTVCPNFIKFSMHIACDRISVLHIYCFLVQTIPRIPHLL